ncbi:hypothetical protein BKI52_27135 [marine bacterium AO1-C]|nr:hypothetical protein BKI52_27135 [marine bacterium AO1-C]
MFFRKKKKGVKAQDEVWISKVEKYQGLYNHLKHTLQEDESLLLINQFENTEQEVKQILAKLEVGHQDLQATTIDLDAVNIFLATPEQMLMIAKSGPLTPQLRSRGGFRIIIVEHHPSYEQEQILLEHLQELFPTLTAKVLTSLDEPFMQTFGSERITKIMGQLGLKENESLEHTMISKSIARAQQKIDKSVSQNISAGSQQEWMDRSGL